MAILADFEKQPWEVKDKDIDISEWKQPGDSIASLSAEVSPVGLTVVDPPTNNDPLIKVWYSGGTDGIKYIVTVKITMTSGRREEEEFTVKVKEIP